MTAKRKGRPPSFELVQVLYLVAGGHPVISSAARYSVPANNVWRVLKAYGGDPPPVLVERARRVLLHYRQPLPPFRSNEAPEADQAAPPGEPGVLLGCGR